MATAKKSKGPLSTRAAATKLKKAKAINALKATAYSWSSGPTKKAMLKKLYSLCRAYDKKYNASFTPKYLKSDGSFKK